MRPPDHELLSEFAENASESAFRALVQRHVGLVFSAALRQTGNRGISEEITQNVFLSLARKAPHLRRFETLAGWLHRAAILEARARCRAEIRRVKREEIAAEMAVIEREGDSPLAAAEPLLDEALLNLRDGDRVALMLRFWDNRTFHDVGRALGVDEEAARKRVSRALERIAGFFSRNGFQVGGAAGCALLLTKSVSAAPPIGLATTAANTALAGAATTAPTNVILLKVMALTKTQTAVACLIIAAVPLTLQHRAEARLNRELAAVTQSAALVEDDGADMQRRLEAARADLTSARQDHTNTQERLATVLAKRAALPAVRAYQWDDSASLLRFPKRLIKEINVPAIQYQKTKLTPEIQEILQFTPAEAEQAQAALDRFLDAYNAARRQSIRRVDPTEKDLQGRSPDQVRVFELPEIPFKEMRQKFFDELTGILGSDRMELFRNAVQHWMPIEDINGVNSGWAVYDFGYRLRLLQPRRDESAIQWSVEVTSPHHSAMSASYQPDDVPELYRPYIQDWIATAQANELNKPKR